MPRRLLRSVLPAVLEATGPDYNQGRLHEKETIATTLAGLP
jgi:hypothetical protein